MFKKYMISSVLLASVLFANENSITIYDNIAFLDQFKKIDKIDKGVSEIVYENVSPNLISDSVLVSFPGNVSLIEQNYKYDTVNFRNILLNNINEKVLIKNYTSKEEFVLVEALLLSVENNTCVIKLDEQAGSKYLIKSVDINDVQILQIPNGMITKPSLLFKINSDQEHVNKDINLKYLSNGFSWNANYVFNINKDMLEINGLINLSNNSDVTLRNYNLKVIAGELNMNRPVANSKMYARKTMELMSMDDSASNIENQSVSGYHLYKIPFKVDIDKMSQKQIQFINKKIAGWEKVNTISLNEYGSVENMKFDQNIRFTNDKEALGIPLPKGQVRFYELNQNDNSNYFVGENNIRNTALNEKVSLSYGKDFDSFINKKTIESKQDGPKYKFIHSEYLTYNNSKEIKKYEISQHSDFAGFLKKDVEIMTDCNKANSCSYEWDDLNVIKIKYELLPESNRSFYFKISNIK